MKEQNLNGTGVFLPPWQQPRALWSDRVAPAAALAPAALLAAVVFINESTFRLGDVEHFSVDWQVLLRLAVCGACGLYGFLHRSTALAALGKFPGLWIVLFGVWSLVTVPFAANPPYAASSCAALWCAILFAPAVLADLGPRRLLTVLVSTLCAFIIGSWIVYFALPELGRTAETMPDLQVTYRLGGLSHANGLGSQTALTIGLLLVMGQQHLARWRRLAPWLLLAVVTLVFTGSRTATLAAAAAAALLTLRRGKPELMLGGALLLVALVGLALLLVRPHWHSQDLDALLANITRSGQAEEMYKLTGRTEIWRDVGAKILASPLVGYGYACSRFVIQELDYHHEHNLLLHVTLTSGFFGGLLFLAMLLTQARGLLWAPSDFPDVITVLIVVGGITEPLMFGPVVDSHTLLWFIALLWRQSGASLQPAGSAVPQT